MNRHSFNRSLGKRRLGKRSSGGHYYRLHAAVFLLLALCAGASAQSDLCITPTDGVTGAPTLDGIVYAVPSQGKLADAGWTNAVRFNLNASMGTTRTGYLQLVRTATDVYLSLVIETPAADTNDAIVIALSTDGVAAHDWRIQFLPFDIPTEADTQVPHTVTFWRDSDHWNDGTPDVCGVSGTDGTGNWTKNNTRFSYFSPRWAIEMRIPILTDPATAVLSTGVFFPGGATPFKVYVDVLNTSTLLGMVTQSPWPAGTNIVAGASHCIEHNTPAKTAWGIVSFDPRPACTGVKIGELDVGVISPPAPDVQSMRRFKFGSPEVLPADCTLEDNIAIAGPVNTFFARPTNTMSTTATKISVTYSTANWGITNTWTPLGSGVGVTANPTSPNAIGAGSQAGITDFNSTWGLTRRQSCENAKGNGGHQCMLVEMDSPDASVRFLNSSTRRNMNFVPASKFSDRAEINLKPPTPGATQKVALIVDTDIANYQAQRDAGRFCKTRPAPPPNPNNAGAVAPNTEFLPDDFRCIPTQSFPKGLTQAMIWLLRGYRISGDFLIINKKKYEVGELVGSFGYVAGHNGPVAEWKQSLEGDGLKKLGSNTYTIEIPPEKVVVVLPTIEAVEPGQPPTDKRFGLSLHAGGNFPHGTFGNLFDPGFSFTADLEYRLTNSFSLEALYGYNRFRGKSVGPVQLGDINLHNFSLNGKYYVGSGTTRPFVNFGFGAYKFDPGDTKFGANIGTGLQFNVTPVFAVEGAYNFHSVFTTGSNTKFSTIQGGVRFRF